MARTRSIRRSPKKTKRTVRKGKQNSLSHNVQAFIARRLVDGFAFVLTLGGGFIIFALLSYSQSDPSWNTAAEADADIANWMGGQGAWVADLFLQTLGLGALVLGGVLVVWGARSFRRQALSPLWLRGICALIAALSLSIACSQIPSGGWLSHPYMGSSAGTLILNVLGPMGSGVSSWFGPVTISIVFGALACALGAYAAAVTRDEVALFMQRSWFLMTGVALYLIGLVQGFRNWIAHHNDPDYRPDPMAVLKAFPKITPTLSSGSSERKSPVVQAEPPAAQAVPKSEPQAAAPVAQKPQGDIPVVTSQAAKKVQASPQQNFSLDGEDWKLPPLDLLETPPEGEKPCHLNEDALRKNAELLQNVLADFNVEGDITSIYPGPVVTLYELEPAPGVKSAKVIGLADDIARSMSAVSVRVAVVPGRNVIGIELPNKTREMVYMQELLASELYEKDRAALPLVLGKDIGGQPILADLAKMPHLLVAGTTGSGKSVAVNTMILSLLYRLSPEKCRFIMIDPKMLELSVYDGIPHLLTPVVTEPGKAVVALKWTVNEMEERYRAMSKLGVRNVDGYNARIREAIEKGEVITKKVQTGFDDNGAAVYEDQPMDLVELPYIVVIVDEFADLMLVAGKDVEGAIQRLAQMARAAGIHLIMATQRPSVDVITGVIKANFPTRISFQVTSKVDSRTILGEGGAEQLLGRGDMLYMAPGGRVTRVHGPFVSDPDVEKVVRDLKGKAEPAYIDSITSGEGLDASEVMNAIFEERGSGGEQVDELYDQAVALVAREGKASTSFVQRYLQIGYNRAARIIEEMERQGVISAASPTGKREVLVSDFSEAG